MTDSRKLPSEDEVLGLARAARARAYAPYSKFRVGAAIVLKSGRVVSGCNVENISYGATICAERTAMVTAIGTYDERDVSSVVIVSDGAVPPCGMCLQVLAEFCAATTPIILADETSIRERLTFKDLLPHAFGPGAFISPLRG